MELIFGIVFFNNGVSIQQKKIQTILTLNLLYMQLTITFRYI